MAQRRLPQRVNVGPQALRHAQRLLTLPSYTTGIPPAASLTETFDSVTYQATGAGISHQAAPSGSWTDFIPTTTNCAVVWMSAMPGSNVSATVTIGGINVPAVSGNPFIYASGYNELQCFVLMNPPTGTQTVTVTFSGTNYFHATSVYYSGVGAVGSPTFVTGAAGTQPSQTVTTTAGKFYAQAFAFRPNDGNSTFTTYTPGGMLALFGNPSNGYSQPLVVGDALGAGADITFSATRNNTSWPWGGVVIPLTCAPIPTRWTNWGTATNVGGMLSCIPSTNYDGGIGSVQAYDLTGDDVAIQLVTPPNVGNGGTMCSLELGPVQSGTNPALHAWSWSNGQLAASNQSGWLWWTTYDPYNHAFLRIREAGGTVYYETSPDGSSWITQTSTPATFSMSSTYVRIYSGYGGTEPDPGVALWDNLNLAPSVTTYNPTRAAGRNAGPLALRQIIRHRPQPSSPPSVSPSAKIATFTETFNTLDPTIWATVSGTPSSTYGQLTLPCASTYSTVQSVASYDLTDSSVYVNLTQTQAAGNGTTDTIFGVTSNAQYVWFQVVNGQLVTLDTTTGSTTTQPYDPIAHQFLRIRANGSGTMWWESSPDASTWIQVATSTGSGLSVGNAQVYFSCGYDGVEDNPLPAMFTDLNLPPSLPTRTAVIPVSRKTGPMALRRRIMRRQQPVYPTLANGYMVDSTIAVTASRTANSNWYAYADATQTITPRGLGLETVSPPTWVGTGPGKAQGTSPLTFTDSIPVGTTYTLLFGQLLCASATLPTITTTIGGQSATLVDSVYASPTGGNYLYGFCFALANPPTGSQTVTFTSNSILVCAVNTVHYSGVGSLGPVSKIGQQAGQPSFSVGTDAKYGYAQAFLYAAAAAGNGFSSYNQNQRWTISTVLNVNGPLLIGDATGNGGTLTFSATRDNTTNGWGAIVVPLAPVSAGAIYGATAATALPITATRLANVTWAAKAAALQQVTASPAAEYSRGQPASATQSITAIPDSTGSRGQTVESTETITVSTDAIGSRGQDIDSPLVVTADLLSMVTWQGWFDAAQVITASDTANAIWALRANAAQQITASYTALASYGATGNALLPITASPLLSNVIWDAQALSDLIVTASTPTIGSRWQPIDSTQAITALLSGIGSRGQFVDSTLGLTIAALPAAISYGATGNAPLVITVNLLTSDTLLDNHAYAALVVNAGRPTSVIWDTRADSRLTVTTHFWATFGRLLNVDANLTVVTRLTAALRAVFLSNASLGIVAGLPTKLSRWQPIDSTQAITATPAGGIVWHGRIGAPLRITATPLGNAIWDAHANSQMTVTESGLIVVSRGQDIDPALDITADTSGEFTQTMSGDVEQAILALPDTELSLGSTMDSALSLIVTYSADIGEALRGGNFFYFYL